MRGASTNDGMTAISSNFFAKIALIKPAGLINAIFAKKFDDIAVIPSFVLAPLTYLGGVFYTVSLLPEFWQTLSRFNPILYMINSMRYSVIGISDVSIQNALMMIVVFFILLFATAVILLKKGIGIRQ